MRDHETLMRRALQLAERGLYTTSPNPRVGCVIVSHDNRIIGEGFTQPAGQNHAEIQALNDARARGENVRGATAYVTLEPCAHYGRTPPCCDALIREGLAEVVAAIGDPNPLVAGQGFARLQAAGIHVTSGVLAAEAEEINRGFIKRMRTGRPLLRLKIAASLDARTALSNGESKWISSVESRHDVQHWRARSCAILTGLGTVLADDPLLNVREIDTPRQPVKVIADSQLRTPHHAKLLAQGRTLIATTVKAPQSAPYANGVEIIKIGERAGRLDLPALVDELGRQNFNEVTTEAGATLNGALISAGLADELLLYLAPRLLGGDARPMLHLPALQKLADASQLEIFETKMLGPDIRIRARFLPAAKTQA